LSGIQESIITNLKFEISNSELSSLKFGVSKFGIFKSEISKSISINKRKSKTRNPRSKMKIQNSEHRTKSN
jgi:hypothetical protein